MKKNLLAVVLFAIVFAQAGIAHADQSDQFEASNIAQGEVGGLGERASLFVLTQLKYDYDIGRCVQCRWYGWANSTSRTRELAAWVWSQDGYLYPRCRFTISEQDRLLFVSYGWIEQGYTPEFTFASDRLHHKAHGVFCKWDDWADRVEWPTSRDDLLE